MTKVVHAGMTKVVHTRMTKVLACGHDYSQSRHTGRYEVSIRYLPNSLAPFKWPFTEIPAQEHAGMTKVVHTRMTKEGKTSGMMGGFCNSKKYEVLIRIV